MEKKDESYTIVRSWSKYCSILSQKPARSHNRSYLHEMNKYYLVGKKPSHSTINIFQISTWASWDNSIKKLLVLTI